MSYNVRLFFKAGRRGDVVENRRKTGLDEVTLERQFLRPFREGRDMIVEGRTVPIAQNYRVGDLPYLFFESGFKGPTLLIRFSTATLK
jgi:hypothetical protein